MFAVRSMLTRALPGAALYGFVTGLPPGLDGRGHRSLFSHECRGTSNDRRAGVGRAALMRPMLETLCAQAHPAHTALIIVDMQKDFCTPGYGAEQAGRDLSAAQRAIPNIARLLTGARAVGATVAHVGFWTLPDNGSDSDSWLQKRLGATVSSPTLCIADTNGAMFIDELAPARGELQIRKHRYSAFTATNLDLLLRARGVRTVIVTGVSTNVCVETTFRAAFELGYYVLVPTDGCASWDQDLHDAALANVRHRFGLTPAIEDILACWEQL